MPRIRVFQAIRPLAEAADKIVVGLENYTLEEAKIIREDNPLSFIHMLAPKLDRHFQLGSKLELAYKTINFNFEDFLNKGLLIQDSKPFFYIYQVRHSEGEQTGLWTTTCIDDYLNNTIKKHEFTFPERERKLVEYLRNTGIDTNPVLITYPSDTQIDRIINKYLFREPVECFTKGKSEHRLWRIENNADSESIATLFSSLSRSYIADGHHRAAAAANYALERRKMNSSHNGEEAYNFFSSVYMTTDQVKIFEFNRAVKDLGSYTPDGLLYALESDFIVKRVANNQSVKPTKVNHFGMYLEEVWYELTLNEDNGMQENRAGQLDVEILQTLVLEKLLKIQEAEEGSSVDFFSGVIPIDILTKKVDQGEYAVVFTLAPVEIEQLIKTADQGRTMPPKSTYFEPKFFLGLLTHKIN